MGTPAADKANMVGAANDLDRRRDTRYACAGDAEIVLPGRGLRFEGRIADLSTGGCFIETGCRLERGTSVEVWLQAQGMPLRVAANLITRRDGGAAFHFHGVTARKMEQIQMLIAELAAAERSGDRNGQAHTAE